MRLLCVDPGLASTALVLFDRGRISAAHTLTTPSEGPRPKFAACVKRAEDLSRALLEAGMAMEPDIVVVELYRDIPGALRNASNRWATPLTIGLLIPTLRALTEDGSIVWQDPELVMTRYAGYKLAWKAGTRGICRGDELLRNDHLRAAAAHGLFYIDTHKRRS